MYLFVPLSLLHIASGKFFHSSAAYPATLRDVSSVQDVNGMNAEVKTAFTKTVVSVEGANGYQAIDYNMNKLVQSDGDTLILDGGNAAV